MKARHTTPTDRTWRIGLITPYAGGNLGNAAILEATIANLRKRIDLVELVGITLNPEDTTRRHRIPAFPLTGTSRRYYGLRSSPKPSIPGDRRYRLTAVKSAAKKLPIVGSLLKAVSTLARELTHFVKAALFVRTLDQLVIPGGGALDEQWGGPWGHPWSLFKWSVLGRVFRVPVWFISVGKCSLERPLSRLFLRYSLRVATYRSYRDETSKSCLQGLLNVKCDPVIPDLAFSYLRPPAPEHRAPASRDQELWIGVSPIAFCDPRSWPDPDGPRYSAYVAKLAQFVQWLIDHQYRVLLFASDSPDVAVISELEAMLNNHSGSGLLQVLPRSEDQTATEFLRAISKCKFVVASRLHGLILSHLLCIPAVAISYDIKVDSHMASVDQSKYSIDIDKFRPDILLEKFKLLMQSGLREQAHLQNATTVFRRQLETQYSQLTEAAHAGGARRRNNDAGIVESLCCPQVLS